MSEQMLGKARAYEEKYGARIPSEERPVYHLSPRVGWMNDPNGFSVFRGQYHLFYQYHPYTTRWGPMHWGHAVSRDMLHWDYLPAALAPDKPYDSSGCFSGSALELDDGRHLLMYTGVRQSREADGEVREFQTQCLAAGDGCDYEKYTENPVLDGKDIPEGFSLRDFRDPKLFRNADGSYGCVVANRTEDGSGAVLLFRSSDGFHWEFVSELDRSRNEYGRMWECPDFFRLEGRDVLLTNPQEMQAQGLEYHSGNCTMALIGQVQDGVFRREAVQSLDYGLDFYAPQTLLTADGRRILIGWMQNWDTTGLCPENAAWFGQMTVPRELSFRGGRLIQNPIRELETLRGGKVTYENIPVHEKLSLEGISGRVADLTVTVRPADDSGFSLFRIRFAEDSRHHCELTYHPETATVHLSRIHAGFRRDAVHERSCAAANRNGEIRLRILLDRYSAEVFVNDGEQVLTMTFYTPQTADGIRFECSANALISVEKYELLAGR